MNEHTVVIVGGGPTGLMLAGELALAGVDVAIVERRADRTLAGSRAGGLHARTLETFEQRGIADRFVAEGQKAYATHFCGVALDLAQLPTRFPYTLGLWQNHIERLLGDWVDALPVAFHRGRDVVGFAQYEAGVDVALSDGTSLRAGHLVGCDGGRSIVRKTAGIAFPGSDATTSSLIAEVELAQTPEWGVRHDAIGTHGIGRVNYEIRDGAIVYAENGPVRVMVTEREIGAAGEPTLDELRAALIAVYGTDYGVHDATWISRFTDMTRQAAAYRDGRVLLAGDAAHVHAPDGGQGLQLGVQDAANLGWKLAQVAKGVSPSGLLDTYHAERHPVVARALRATMAHVALRRVDDRTAAVRDTIAEMLGTADARSRFAARMVGLDIRYGTGEGHPLLGRRMPDLDLATARGATRVASLLHRARPVLLEFAAPARLSVGPWADRVVHVAATTTGEWRLPAVGTVAAPAAVLIRPDGYVAWVGEGTRDGLEDALAFWFGRAV